MKLYTYKTKTSHQHEKFATSCFFQQFNQNESKILFPGYKRNSNLIKTCNKWFSEQVQLFPPFIKKTLIYTNICLNPSTPLIDKHSVDYSGCLLLFYLSKCSRKTINSMNVGRKLTFPHDLEYKFCGTKFYQITGNPILFWVFVCYQFKRKFNGAQIN